MCWIALQIAFHSLALLRVKLPYEGDGEVVGREGGRAAVHPVEVIKQEEAVEKKAGEFKSNRGEVSRRC